MTLPERFKVVVITLSDRAYRGEYADLSGPEVVRHVDGIMSSAGWTCHVSTVIIPDDALLLRRTMEENSDADLIITTGGTGIGPRDITVDVVRPLLTKELPGIMELIRVKYGTENAGALLSRAVSGIKDKTVIYTLPGSVRAVNEYMTEIGKTLVHTFYMLYGIDRHRHA